MKTAPKEPQTIDEYISGFPGNVRVLLRQVRKTIRAAAPGSREAIKYRMPTFVLEGNLIHFAAMKNHIGLYPTPSGIVNFRKELSTYVTTKGAIQFPLDRPIPHGLIAKITRFRVREQLEKAKRKKKVNP
jgi:uncharacterized protein YdhG (YjbR/CyaY superfamily)